MELIEDFIKGIEKSCRRIHGCTFLMGNLLDVISLVPYWRRDVVLNEGKENISSNWSEGYSSDINGLVRE